LLLLSYALLFNGLLTALGLLLKCSNALLLRRWWIASGDLGYVLGKFNAMAVYEVKIIISNSPATKHTSIGIGAGYDFGVVNTRVTYQNGTLDTVTAGIKSPWATVTVTKFTAIAQVTPVIDIFGGYVILAENNARTMYSASSLVAGKATLMNVGAQYEFSKRTNVYAHYTSLDIDANSKFGTTSAVRHYFFRLSRISLSNAISSGVGGADGASIVRTLFTTFTIWKMTKANRMKLIEIVMKLP